MKDRNVKIGIDVGGTFTHAVAMETGSLDIIGKACVPTTHTAWEGVARGVIESLHLLLSTAHISPARVTLIAHSTTQATNALLEGDVAAVGIIGMGRGLERRRARHEANLQNIELAPGKFLKTFFRFIDTTTSPSDQEIADAISSTVREGAEVVVATEAFGVDDGANEVRVVRAAEAMGLKATAASAISKLYGLRVRTRTAVINASMLPRMLETAAMTEEAVRKSGIKAPLMVMRSDGGIMDINEMRKRPILTMLSGPAAGVTAALMYAKVSDAIFLEVGGTSTDISVIKNGKPQIKSAQIGRNRLYLRTLDVRTRGIAGGSLARGSDTAIKDVGPRSAHIANLAYIAYGSDDEFNNAECSQISPSKGDPADYFVVRPGTAPVRYGFTPADAAALLGAGKTPGSETVNTGAVQSAFTLLSQKLHRAPETLATDILSIAAKKIEPVVHRLAREYKLDRELMRFVGGGGGASALVPFTAKAMGVPYTITENADVISAIGAALGMIRDSIEKTVLQPTESDILALRQEVINSVLAMGAVPDSVETTIEIDSKNKKVIAVAMGTNELRTKSAEIQRLSEDRLLDICAASLRTAKDNLFIAGRTTFLSAVATKETHSRIFGLLRRTRQRLRVIDREGTIRLQLSDCIVDSVQNGAVRSKIREMIETLTTFGDAGALVPNIFLLISAKIIDLTGLIKESQIMALVDLETSRALPTDEIVVIASVKQ